jgi:ABC-2 type transport system ATP-binding protein
MSHNSTVAELIRQVRQRIVLQIQVTGDHESAARTLEQSPLVESVALGKPGTPSHQLAVTLREGVEDYTDLSSLLISTGHKIKLFREEEVNLESAFMALTTGSGQRF